MFGVGPGLFLVSCVLMDFGQLCACWLLVLLVLRDSGADAADADAGAWLVVVAGNLRSAQYMRMRHSELAMHRTQDARCGLCVYTYIYNHCHCRCAQ
jgi:hypothetical protein